MLDLYSDISHGVDLSPGAIGSCGPLVEPFPGNRKTLRDCSGYTTRQVERIRERFRIAEDYIRARDTTRELARLGLAHDTTGTTVYLKGLMYRFDELEFSRILPRPRVQVLP